MYKEVVTKIINNIMVELKNESNMDNIKNNIIEPIIHATISRLYPYLIFFIIAMSILFISIFFILFLNIKICYK